MDINTVALTGNLTRDPELRQVGDNAVVSMRVASQGFGDKTNYFDVAAWGKLAGLCDDFLSKGSAVAVSGRLEYREYTDKEGNKRAAVQVTANDVKFPPKGSNASAPTTELDFS